MKITISLSMYVYTTIRDTHDKEIPVWPSFAIQDTNRTWYVDDPKYSDDPTESGIFMCSNGARKEYFKLGKSYILSHVQYYGQVEMEARI